MTQYPKKVLENIHGFGFFCLSINHGLMLTAPTIPAGWKLVQVLN